MRPLIYSILFIVLPFFSFSQVIQPTWKTNNIPEKAKEDWAVQPVKFLKADMPFDNFYQSLVENNGELHTIILPDNEGNLVEFSVRNQSVFEEKLRLKFAGFYSYFGTQKNNRENTIALSISPYGMNAMVTEATGNIYYIDPVTLHSKNEYLVYTKKDLVNPAKNRWFCKPFDALTDQLDDEISRQNKNQHHERAGDCRLRTYRLALACTGEYGTFHGGTKEKVLHAFQIAVTRINSVYRKEIGIFFRLVDNTDQLIFFNASTDPYTNNDTGAMLSQNQTTVDQIIGRANYDIGHVFGTGDGGIASLGSVCSNNRKAQGVTGRPNPVGDAFFIDYVAHEIGHQFRANHTQNNDCQRNGPTAVEPGSGSTIMGYAGICSPDVQNNSHDYFHTISLSEISSFILSQPACGVTENFNNSRPGLTVPKNSYSTPVSTPFYLTAQGSDNDEDDVLTFTWEQMNNETAQMPPRATSTTGPMFRSVPPNSSPTRYLPDLKNKYGQWEVLPSVSRTMNFRCTVRDNSDLGGCTTELNVTVNTVTSSGPFLVTQPNTSNIVWEAGQTATVTWNVANTDLAPVNSQLVDVWLSLDGGTSYPIKLATSVPNSGSTQIIVPNTPTTIARVMVISADNIFFDFSNFSFTIKSSLLIEKEEKKKEICGEEVLFPIKISSLQNNSGHDLMFDEVVSPQGVTITFPQNVMNLPLIDTLKIRFAFSLPPGNYPIVYKITDGPYTIFDTLFVVSRGGINQPLPLLQPANGMQFGAGQNLILLQWQSDISGSYELQISTAPSFADSITEKINLNRDRYPFFGGSQLFFWRVRAKSDCTELPWSDVYMFSKSTKPKRDLPLLRLNALVVEHSATDTIQRQHLYIEYEEALPFSLRVIEKPIYGYLLRVNQMNVDTLQEGDYFTAEDIRLNRLQYQHDGQDVPKDGFSFMIENEASWGGPYQFDIYVIPQQDFSAFIEIDKDIACFGEQANLFLSVQNGAPPYSIANANDNVFSLLENPYIPVGNGQHSFIIRDANQQETFTNIVMVTSPALLTNETRQVNYDLQIRTTGGAGFTREFSLDGNTFGQDSMFQDIGNGSWITVVRDVNGCLAIDTTEIQISALTIDSLLYEDSLACFRNETVLTPYISGGIPPYRLFINDTELDVFPVSIQAGQYTFTVRDEGNKMAQATIQIIAPDDITPNLVIERRDVTWQPAGGTPPYEYSFDGTQFSSLDFALDLANGTYELTIRDANACTVSESFTISVLETVHVEIQHPACYGENGSVVIEPENGTAPFFFGLDRNNLDTIKTFSDLPAGNYVVFAADAAGDTIEQAFQIIQPDSLQISFDIRSDTLIIIADGGTPPYTFSADGGFTYLAADTFYNVPKGTYQIAVKDANDCTKEGVVEITYSSTSNQDISDLITIHPNPVFGNVRIESGKINIAEYTLTLRDATGRIVHADKKVLSGTMIEIEAASLLPGMYFIHLQDQSTSMTFRLVKL